MHQIAMNDKLRNFRLQMHSFKKPPLKKLEAVSEQKSRKSRWRLLCESIDKTAEDMKAAQSATRTSLQLSRHVKRRTGIQDSTTLSEHNRDINDQVFSNDMVSHPRTPLSDDTVLLAFPSIDVNSPKQAKASKEKQQNVMPQVKLQISDPPPSRAIKKQNGHIDNETVLFKTNSLTVPKGVTKTPDLRSRIFDFSISTPGPNPRSPAVNTNYSRIDELKAEDVPIQAAKPKLQVRTNQLQLIEGEITQLSSKVQRNATLTGMSIDNAVFKINQSRMKKKTKIQAQGVNTVPTDEQSIFSQTLIEPQELKAIEGPHTLETELNTPLAQTPNQSFYKKRGLNVIKAFTQFKQESSFESDLYSSFKTTLSPKLYTRSNVQSRVMSPQTNMRKSMNNKPLNQILDLPMDSLINQSIQVEDTKLSRLFSPQVGKRHRVFTKTVLDDKTQEKKVMNYSYPTQQSEYNGPSELNLSVDQENNIRLQKDYFKSEFFQKSQKPQVAFSEDLETESATRVKSEVEKVNLNELLEKLGNTEPQSQMMTKQELGNLLKELDEMRKLRTKDQKPKNQWMKHFKMTKLNPIDLKRMIEKGVIGMMPGQDVNEKKRRSSLVGITKTQIRQQRKDFFENTSALLEMQQTLMDSKFKDQVLKADPKTQVFFNDLMKQLNKQSLNLQLAKMNSKQSSLQNNLKLNKLLSASKISLSAVFGEKVKLRRRSSITDTQTITLCGNKYSPTATALLKRLRVALQKFVMIQLKIDSKKDSINMGLKTQSKHVSRKLSRAITIASGHIPVEGEELEKSSSSQSDASSHSSKSSSSDSSSKTQELRKQLIQARAQSLVQSHPRNKQKSSDESKSGSNSQQSSRRASMFSHHGVKTITEPTPTRKSESNSQERPKLGKKLNPLQVTSVDGMSRFSKFPTPIWEQKEEKTARSGGADQMTSGRKEVRLISQGKKTSPQKRVMEDAVKSVFSKNYNINAQRRRTTAELISRFQAAVATRLIKKPLKDIQSFDRGTCTMKQTFALLNLNRFLRKVLKSTTAETIGQQYLMLGLNQFKNEYLREVIQKKPEYNDYLRVFNGDGDYRTHKIAAVNYDHGREEDYSLNKVFEKQTDHKAFYDVVKKQKVNEDEEKDDQLAAYMDYYDSCGRDKAEVPINMNLIHFHNRIQYIYNKVVTLQQGKAINKFLTLSKDRKESQVREMVIDSCGMTDEVLCEILGGALEQVTDDGSKRRQYLYNFVYSNNSFGEKSLEKLLQLTPDLIEMRLNNVNVGISHTIMDKLTEHFGEYEAAPYIMKLAFSNMVLNDQRVILNLTDFMNMKKHLQFFDVSFSSIGPYGLNRICEQLMSMNNQIRDVNLSYNHLNFGQEGSENHKNSLEAMDFLKTLIKKAKVLNHLNLSGMSIDKSNMLDLIKQMVDAALIMAVHLNDNGITRDSSYFKEAIEMFGLTFNDIPWSRKEELDNFMDFYEPPDDTKEVQDNGTRKYVDVAKRVQIYMRFKAPDTAGAANKLVPSRKISAADLNEQDRIDKIVNQKRGQLRDHFMLGKEFRNYQHQKAMNASKDKFGVGRAADNIQDQFTITRVINHPELIFNQRTDWDNQLSKRFFNVDQNLLWHFSKQTECLVCNRYQYTQIFYQRGVLAQNKGLVEINDVPLLEELRYQYQKDKTIFMSNTPLIMGSVIKKEPKQGLFERKLKMLRTPLYAILAICQCREFFPDQSHVKGLKNAIKEVLVRDSNKLMDEVGINEKLKGWSHIISDMCLHNELTDVRSINRPELSAYNVEVQEWFTFAGFLKPGYHQIIIYDPLLDRAFCKDFVAKLNQRDFVYPEYPIHLDKFVAEQTPNVWKAFVDNNPNILSEIFFNTVKSEQFGWSRLSSQVIKNRVDEEAILQLLKENIGKIVLFQQHMIYINDRKFPLISFDFFYKHFMEIQLEDNFNYNQRLLKANVELPFQASKTDGSSGLGGGLARAELMNFLIRMVQQWKNMDKSKSSKDPISESFNFFFHVYIDPVIEKSKMIKVRKIIRGSKKLNDLLYHNREGLKQIFEVSKKFEKDNTNGKNGFTIGAARSFYQTWIDRKTIQCNPSLIDESFIYSQMTVQNEFTKSRKYFNLVYIEWLELLCRLCHEGFQQSHHMFAEPLAYRVQHLMKSMWHYMYVREYWERGTKLYEFVEVDQEVLIEQ